MSVAIPLSEGDLHGLVDGRLDPGRRADALRALAASPADRAKVDAWQDQNDLIRATFAGVELEPLPLSMRLAAPPSLHCVPSPVSTLHAPTSKAPRPRGWFFGVAVVLLAFGGLGASWMLLQQADDSPQVVDLGLRGPTDASLATIASDTVADDIGRRTPPQAAPKAQALGAPLPTTTIPDLSSAGFVFIRAESHALTPQALVFHYRGAAAERVVLSVARSDAGMPDTAPAPIGRSLTWHRGAATYAVAGSVQPERLRSIATLIRSAEIDE